MGREKVEQKKFTFTISQFQPAMQFEKKKETIVIPFRTSDQIEEPKPASTTAEFYGLTVEKDLVEKVEYKGGKYPSPEITLKNGTEVTTLGSGENIKFMGNKPKVYKDKDGYIVFENLKNADVAHYGKIDDKIKLKNTDTVLLYTGGGTDSVKVENVYGGGIQHSSEGRLTLVDGAKDPTNAPSLIDARISKDIDNKLFWTEKTTLTN